MYAADQKMYWASIGNSPSIEMAFLDGSRQKTLYSETSAQYTGITLFNNSLYISDSSRRFINFLTKQQTTCYLSFQNLMKCGFIIKISFLLLSVRTRLE